MPRAPTRVERRASVAVSKRGLGPGDNPIFPGLWNAAELVAGGSLLVAQVGLGLLLLSSDHRAPEQLHYAYGTFALLAVLSPWLYAPSEPRARLTRRSRKRRV